MLSSLATMVKRVVAISILAAAIVVAYLTGAFELLDPERIRTGLEESGPWGPLVYVASFALLEPMFVPGILFIVPASFIWPPWLAFGLSWIGSIGAGIVGFSFARWVGRDWIEERLPERLRAYDRRLEEHGLTTVIVVRLLFFLAPPAHWALGLSRVRFAPFVLGTAIGFVPGIALLTFVGPQLFDFMSGTKRPGLLVAGVLLVVVLGLRLARHVRLGVPPR